MGTILFQSQCTGWVDVGERASRDNVITMHDAIEHLVICSLDRDVYTDRIRV